MGGHSRRDEVSVKETSCRTSATMVDTADMDVNKEQSWTDLDQSQQLTLTWTAPSPHTQCRPRQMPNPTSMKLRTIEFTKQDATADPTASFYDDASLTVFTAPAKSKKLAEPRRCKRLQHMDVVSDDDIWVERSYRNAKGRKICYYCSVHTNRKQLFEPPSGAAMILRESQHVRDEVRRGLPVNVLRVVLEQHTRDELRAIPGPILKSSKAKPMKWMFGVFAAKESAS